MDTYQCPDDSVSRVLTHPFDGSIRVWRLGIFGAWKIDVSYEIEFGRSEAARVGWVKPGTEVFEDSDQGEKHGKTLNGQNLSERKAEEFNMDSLGNTLKPAQAGVRRRRNEMEEFLPEIRQDMALLA